MVEQMDIFASSVYDDTPKQEEKKDNSLTTRQKLLYKLIEHNSLVENRKTTQREIVDTISGYEWNDDPRIHDHCSMIWNDINKIKNCEDVNFKVIMSNNFLYWVGSDSELKEYAENYFESDITPRLKRYWNMIRKSGGTIESFDLFLNEIVERFRKCTR